MPGPLGRCPDVEGYRGHHKPGARSVLLQMMKRLIGSLVSTLVLILVYPLMLIAAAGWLGLAACRALGQVWRR